MLGEEARENGLKVSLLERLQHCYREKIYTKFSQATLQTGFRCQKDILSLASELFYSSSVKVSDTCLSINPHQEFPYPLLFVCSSDKNIRNSDESVNQNEADLLMKILRSDFEQNKINNVCVMSSSRGQVRMYKTFIFALNV